MKPIGRNLDTKCKYEQMAQNLSLETLIKQAQLRATTSNSKINFNNLVGGEKNRKVNP